MAAIKGRRKRNIGDAKPLGAAGVAGKTAFFRVIRGSVVDELQDLEQPRVSHEYMMSEGMSLLSGRAGISDSCEPITLSIQEICQMPPIKRLMRVGCVFAFSFAFVGCGGTSSEQSAPASSDIQQYIQDHPEILEQDELDAVDDAEIE